MRLRGKVAIVTGAGRGIGRAIAEAFVREGAQVVVTAAREMSEIEEVASRNGATAIRADVTDREAVAKLTETVLARFGRIDVLVNNAARGMKYVNERFITDPRPFWEADPDVWRMVIDTNVSGLFLMTHSVAPHMLEQRSGRIINISMNYETMKRKGFTPYGPSKAAVESMSIIWAKELEGSGVTLNVLLPGGATDTGMIPNELPEAMRGRLIDPAVMGPPAVYLASDEGSGVHGERIIALDWNREHPA